MISLMMPQKKDPETKVPEKAKRRKFSAEYKARILAEADRAGPGEVGALLRREGLYSSHLASWRKQREEGAREALGRKRGRKKKRTADQERIAQLEREKAKLERRLEHAQKVIEVQKKLSEVLGIPLDDESTEND